ncbi:LysR family transcriptional regulator substrate-binding protein [Streptomyces sp. KLMMK]|uniref:LysR family transcriptional regulator substrate-binding protein n=1 Tax=Streptomyces sp. KLMMK TaxID=3109353 RepID=UPI002FFEC62E
MPSRKTGWSSATITVTRSLAPGTPIPPAPASCHAPAPSCRRFVYRAVSDDRQVSVQPLSGAAVHRAGGSEARTAAPPVGRPLSEVVSGKPAGGPAAQGPRTCHRRPLARAWPRRHTPHPRGRGAPAARPYSTLLDGILPAVPAWALARPHARLCVAVHENGRSLEESVASGAADLGIGPQPEGWCGQVWPWCTEELVVACAEDDPLRGETVSVRELLGRRWIRCPDDGLQPVPLLAAAAHEASVDASADADEATADRPPPVLDVPTLGAAVTLAASGTGIAVTPLGSLPPGRR